MASTDKRMMIEATDSATEGSIWISGTVTTSIKIEKNEASDKKYLPCKGTFENKRATFIPVKDYNEAKMHKAIGNSMDNANVIYIKFVFESKNTSNHSIKAWHQGKIVEVGIGEPIAWLVVEQELYTLRQFIKQPQTPELQRQFARDILQALCDSFVMGRSFVLEYDAILVNANGTLKFALLSDFEVGWMNKQSSRLCSLLSKLLQGIAHKEEVNSFLKHVKQCHNLLSLLRCLAHPILKNSRGQLLYPVNVFTRLNVNFGGQKDSFHRTLGELRKISEKQPGYLDRIYNLVVDLNIPLDDIESVSVRAGILGRLCMLMKYGISENEARTFEFIQISHILLGFATMSFDVVKNRQVTDLLKENIELIEDMYLKSTSFTEVVRSEGSKSAVKWILRTLEFSSKLLSGTSCQMAYDEVFKPFHTALTAHQKYHHTIAEDEARLIIKNCLPEKELKEMLRWSVALVSDSEIEAFVEATKVYIKLIQELLDSSAASASSPGNESD